MFVRYATLATVLIAVAAAAQGEEPAHQPNAQTKPRPDAPAVHLAPAQSWEAAAKKVQRATVTVRIWDAPADDTQGGEAVQRGETAQRKPEAVLVCSGVCVRPGQVVTAALVGSDSRMRLTLPGGQQADARVQVVDEYSGLALLKTDAPLMALAIAEELPAVGSSVLTAAAWGIEQPLVSQGIVGGVERTRPGVAYPPLLQCDLRTTPTSSGSGIVDADGRLLGIVVAADSEDARRGWAYAVPASHVERLQRAALGQQDGSVIVLKRRRPVVGMQLDQDEEAIVVARVTPGGPAEKAGLRSGDEVLAADGVAIRSVYQAVLPTIFKQPGDTTTFRVRRPDGEHDIRVVLGGGVELSSAPLDFLAGVVQPKVELSRDERGAIVRREPRASIREVAAVPLPEDEPPPAAAPTAGDKIALLEKALDRYRTVIELQQRQLAEEQKRRSEQEELLKTLRREMEALRQAIEAAKR